LVVAFIHVARYAQVLSHNAKCCGFILDTVLAAAVRQIYM